MPHFSVHQLSDKNYVSIIFLIFLVHIFLLFLVLGSISCAAALTCWILKKPIFLKKSLFIFNTGSCFFLYEKVFFKFFKVKFRIHIFVLFFPTLFYSLPWFLVHSFMVWHMFIVAFVGIVTASCSPKVTLISVYWPSLLDVN